MGSDNVFSRILVAVDGSEQSMAAAGKAIKLAKRYDAELIVLYVIQLPTVGHYTPNFFDNVIQKGRQEAEQWFGDIKKKADLDGTKVKTKIIDGVGSPTSEIVDYAEKEKVDLIVTGTRGRSRLTKAVLGSVASGVAARAPCTVMVVR